jgi:hypothetical protein
MRLSRRWKWALLFTAILLVAVGMANTPCGVSSTLPPKPSAAQLDAVRATHFLATLGVETYKYPIYSESLISDLRTIGLFNVVGPSDSLPQAALIAKIERPVYGNPTFPIVALATLGIIPSTVDEEHGYVFSIRTASNPRSTVLIDYTYHGPTTLGCVAHFMNLSPGRTGDNPIETAEFREALAVAVVMHRDAIVKLLQQP